jgi:septal ring factor EnvC (AmiA/AmiB activator)
VLVLCILVASGLLLTCWPASGAARTLSESEQTQLLATLTRADRLLSSLEQRLTEQRQHATELSSRLQLAQQQLGQLQAALTLWREHSEELGISLESLSGELRTLRDSLAESTRRYARLSASWQEYRRTALEEQARTRRRAVLLAVGVGLAGLGAGLLLGR